MTASEEIWVMIGVGGFLLILESCISYVGRTMLKKVSPDSLKFIAGIIIFFLDLGYLIAETK